MSLFSLERLYNLPSATRWGFIVFAFLSIAALDFSTPPEYVWAYLYTVPILISISFKRSSVSTGLITLAIIATLLNLILPHWVIQMPFVLVNRTLAALSILISAFFMLRYMHYQTRIQEQENLLEAERRLSQMREDLTATLTHDLKTPLLGSEKTLGYLAEGTFGEINQEQKDVLAALQRSNARQLELVDSLLSVYRFDNMGVKLQLAKVDLDELTADILTELQSLATEREITLDYICQKTPSKFAGEAFQLKRVIANLVHNALNYTPSGGHVVVELKEEAHQLRLTVSDNGPGIPENDLEQVFHRFFQSGNTRHTLGSGLGLYLSRQIILAHRGKIWAENKPKGGCQFTFTIPLNAQALESMS